jgi:regulator of sigma E protease
VTYALSSLFWFVVVTGILVTWHEFGHFWVARRLGVKTTTFAVGFGPSLFSRIGTDGTVYAVKAIPLGGYVKFIDSREGDVAPADLPHAFDQQPIWKRSLIVLAGPVANLLLTLVAFTFMFMLGKDDLRLVVGNSTGAAASAGLVRYDEIIKVGDVATNSMGEATLELVHRGYEKLPVAIIVRDVRTQAERALTLDLSQLPDKFDEKNPLAAMGITTYERDADTIIALLAPDFPAAQAGLKADDKIVAVNNVAVARFSDFVKTLNAQASQHEGRVELTIERANQRQLITMIAKKMPPANAASPATWRLGIGFKYYSAVKRLGFGAAALESGRSCYYLFKRTLSAIGALFSGQASLKNVSGPITIAQAAEATASAGPAEFLWFLGLVSLSLFIVNLLPIPVLDGGQLMFFAMEWLKGGPLSQNTQFAGQMVGLLAILGLMLLAFYNDLARVFGVA